MKVNLAHQAAVDASINTVTRAVRMEKCKVVSQVEGRHPKVGHGAVSIGSWLSGQSLVEIYSKTYILYRKNVEQLLCRKQNPDTYNNFYFRYDRKWASVCNLVQ